MNTYPIFRIFNRLSILLGNAPLKMHGWSLYHSGPEKTVLLTREGYKLYLNINSLKIIRRSFVTDPPFDSIYFTPKGRRRALVPEMLRLSSLLLQEFLGGPEMVEIADEAQVARPEQSSDFMLPVDLHLLKILAQRE